VQAVLADVTERLRRAREEKAIASVATSLRAAERRVDLVSLTLDQVQKLLEADGVALVTRDPATEEASLELARGAWSEMTGERVAPGKGLSRRVFASGQPFISNDGADPGARADLEVRPATRAIAGIPLIAGERTIGVLWMGRGLDISEDDIVVLTAIGEMTASAIRRIGLHEELMQSNVELTEAYDSTLEGWARVLELRDADTEGHTRRVTELTVRLGRALGCSEEELVQLRRGALLHDIGKVAIPDSILKKPEALDPGQWDIMKTHPQHAFDMLSPIGYLRPALEIPYSHHERWDGTGYPQGLAGEAIPMAARIFAVVDVWDALRSDRPYRKAWPEAKVVSYLEEQAGIRFDPEIVERFLGMVGAPGERALPSAELQRIDA
jgi:GAF domain-containing protein